METSLNLAAGVGGWLIDEPGDYTVRAWLKLPDEIIAAQPLFVKVQPPAPGQKVFAQDYFTDEVARLLAFHGSRSELLAQAEKVLQDVLDRFPESRAALHAHFTLGRPFTSDYKVMKREDHGPMGIAPENPTYRFEEHGPDLELARDELSKVFGKHREGDARDTFGNFLYNEQRDMIESELEDYPEDEAAEEMRDML